MNTELSSVSEQIRRIESLDLEPLKYKLVHDCPREWDVHRADAAEREYKRFLVLVAKYPGVPLVPAGDIDAFWHAHILDTAKYAADCTFALGRFLHHFPYSGLLGEDDVLRQQIALAETRRHYYDEFGEAYAPSADMESCDDCAPDYDCDSNGKVPPLDRPRPRLSRTV